MAEDLHVVMVPWLAFGHLIPFFNLSVGLAKFGIRITFVCTPRNIQRLPKVPPELESLIKFVELCLSPVDGLPDGAEASIDIPMDKVGYLEKAYDTLFDPFKKFIANEKADWIIHDYATHWVTEIGREFGIPQIMFSVFLSGALSYFGPTEYIKPEGQRKYWPSPESLTVQPKWFTFPSSLVCLGHEAILLYYILFSPRPSGFTNGERFALSIEGCQAVAVKSCTEFEGDYLNLLGKLYSKPVIPVGLLPPMVTPENDKEGSSDGEWGMAFKWLDEQKPYSVVYVSFGTEYKLSREEVNRIAHGIELSNLPFLWAFKKPFWAVDGDDGLPRDFKKRIRGRGVVCTGWASQMKILAHPSIGGSLFHSGWGSIVETLQYGHILVVIPLGFDQGLNAKLVVEKGLGVEVKRAMDGSISATEISKALRLAMVDEEGKILRDSAREAKAIFGDQRLHYDKYMGGFVQYLKNNAKPSM